MPIVDVFDEDTDRLARVFKITIISAVDFLLLERFHKALHLGIVIRIADPAHARLDIIGSKHGAVITASILHAAIGMMDQASTRWSTCLDRHFKRRQSEARAQMLFQRPADHSSAERIEQHGQKRELFQQPDISNIGHPELIEVG